VEVVVSKTKSTAVQEVIKKQDGGASVPSAIGALQMEQGALAEDRSRFEAVAATRLIAKEKVVLAKSSVELRSRGGKAQLRKSVRE
jgi:hypothetical protein